MTTSVPREVQSWPTSVVASSSSHLSPLLGKSCKEITEGKSGRRKVVERISTFPFKVDRCEIAPQGTKKGRKAPRKNLGDTSTISAGSNRRRAEDPGSDTFVFVKASLARTTRIEDAQRDTSELWMDFDSKSRVQQSGLLGDR